MSEQQQDRLQEVSAQISDQERYRLLVEGAHDYATILLDTQGRITKWDAGAGRVLGWAEAEVLGQPADLIFTPEDRAAGVPAQEMARAAAQGSATDLRWHMRRDGSRFFADGMLEELRDDAGRRRGFAKILRDATETKHAHEALEAAHRRTAGILESITDAFFVLDSGWRFMFLNPQAGRLLQREGRPLLGKSVWEEFPAAVDGPFFREYHRAVREQTAVSFEAYATYLSSWHEVRAFPTEDGLSVFFHDITDRKTAEAARDRAEARFRLMADAIPHVAWTARPDGGVDYYNARWFSYTGLDFARTRDWGWADVIHPDDLAQASSVWSASLQAGTTSEVEYRLRRADGQYRWHLGRSEPVRDSTGEIVTWVGTATDIETRKQAEAERERLLADAQARAAREALMNRIGAALRATADAEAAQAEVAALLGEALAADRCYFSVYDAGADAVRIVRDWHRPGLTPVADEFRLSEYQESVDTLYAGGTAVIPDALAPGVSPAVARILSRFSVRALLAVPLLNDGRFVAAVAATMSGAPRAWTPAEVSLMESVLTQTRTAAEAARLAARERNISTQLQQALQPPLPESVPGLALTKYYEAALSEASVGGDFYDVFPVEKGCTALVVGDLSGKGLAAAVQVATVKNMLRYALYRARTLVGALEGLNALLVEQSLLSGFATLFVGTYDSGARSLTYANLGQEPALVLSARTGEVWEMPATGPVLGIDGLAVFEQRTVRLEPGDALAVFTDGLTECGPSRREMLGAEGVAALFGGAALPAGVCTAERAEALALRVVAGVDAAAQGGPVRDDVCLLVAVVEGGG